MLFDNLDTHKKSELPLKIARSSCTQTKDGMLRTGVAIDVSFSGKESSFEKYSGNLVVRCPKRELTKSLPCVVEWVELFPPEEKAAGRQAGP